MIVLHINTFHYMMTGVFQRHGFVMDIQTVQPHMMNFHVVSDTIFKTELSMLDLRLGFKLIRCSIIIACYTYLSIASNVPLNPFKNNGKLKQYMYLGLKWLKLNINMILQIINCHCLRSIMIRSILECRLRDTSTWLLKL